MINIIQLTDIHYAARAKSANIIDFITANATKGLRGAALESKFNSVFGPKSHCPDIALGAAKFLATKLHDHHIMLLSGDIATTGTDADLKAAFEYVSSQPTRNCAYRNSIRSPTLGIRKKFAPIPGNHDRFQDSDCTPNGALFEKYFIKQWGNPINRVRTFVIKNNETDEKLHTIAGDFSLTDKNQSIPIGWPACCGQGTAHREVLAEMCDRTRVIRKNHTESGVIWISHFPPTGRTASIVPGSQLNGYPSIISSAKEFDIEFIISGHIHENNEFVESGVRVLTAGSACSFLEKKGNWIRSLSFSIKNGTVSLAGPGITNFRWNTSTKSFQELSS